MTSVEIKELVFSYNDGTPILQGLNLKIEKGEYISIVGHNGSGKSTLAKLIDGLLPFDKGSIIVDGEELNKKNLQSIRTKIAIVFQNPDNQFIGATVEDDIAFSLENMNVPRDIMLKEVKEYASKVGMLDYLNKEPSYLSGGQKQRVAIATALIRKPQILILDEATSMLDPNGKSEILSLVRRMKEENPDLTIISITHDIEEAYLSDKIALLSDGQIVLLCKPNELFKNRDIIEKYNLDVPFIVDLKKELSSLGFKVDDKDSLEEIGEMIWRSK